MNIPVFLKKLIKDKLIPLDKYTKDATALAAVMDFSLSDIDQIQQHPERVILSGSHIVNWYLPSFENAFYGGVMTILRTADYLLQKGGMHQRFLICGEAKADVIFGNIIQAFPELRTCEVIVLNTIQAIHNIQPADFSIATLWTTAYILLKVQNTGLKFYFIQDFEPLFYPAGSTYAQAEATYRFGFYGIANTISLKNIYESEYGGKSIHFTPCVDTRVFYADNSSRKDNPKRIFFYGRPGHPRNAFELAITAMRQLKNRYGSNIKILSAGANWKPKDYGLEGVIENLGLLSYEATGDLYRSCHIGLSMMMTKHPSYLPFEMMACGVLVVSNINNSTKWLLKDRQNCLLSYPSATYIAETISEAIERYEDLEYIRVNAAQEIINNHADWDVEIKKVYNFILNPETKFINRETKSSGVLMQSNGSIFGSMVFYVKNGYRHYVPDIHWINNNGYTCPDDIQIVSDETLLNYLPAHPTPHFWSFADWQNPPRNCSSMQMREIAASRLRGKGIEVGAAASPFPIPLHCSVEYADIYSQTTIKDQLYTGQNPHSLIEPTLITDLEKLESIEDNSLDFIVACHVIEHVKNVLLALKNAYNKLRVGGYLVLVIPDKERTFDKQRKLTTLEHLILDYQNPSSERDREHYVEFYQLAFPTEPDKLYEKVDKNFREQLNIHFHTFTYSSFTLIIDYVCKNINPWSSVWSQPTLSNPTEDIEFYFVLTK
ncbi:glycosyltransferase [Nostoc sp. PA-18-2419]|uniref:rhamnosyltransferase WsaF family glycosyltransferase n=1 Tax=Nostoc sp. PA-18-2419 TaxID=2575443 RepID=UPI00110937DC|nr:glycosyltransferase [Nostoc sp. PA-18-2419]